MRAAAIALAFAVLAACRPPSATTSRSEDLSSTLPPHEARPIQEGVALGMYFLDPSRTYESYLWEIANTGANHVSLVVAWSQPDVRTPTITPTEYRTVADEDLIAAITMAHTLGLDVMIFPIIWIEDRAPGEWRGRIEPVDTDAWWDAYAEFVLHYASIAAEHDVAILSVGSELGSMEADQARWHSLIDRIRSSYAGTLLYSANWDHYARTPFWDAVDLIGVTGYYELTDVEDHVPSVQGVADAWAPIISDLRELSATWGHPVVITELGYVSQRGAARRPWDYTATGAVDLDAQDTLYRGTYAAWHDEAFLGGLYFWNWFGAGGASDNGYSPRNKPAEQIVRYWFGGTLSGEP